MNIKDQKAKALADLNQYMHKDKTFLAKSECIVGWVVNNADTIRAALAPAEVTQPGVERWHNERGEHVGSLITSKEPQPSEPRTEKPTGAVADKSEALNPHMPTQELLLHMGELSKDEILVARAAIAWANEAGR